ncbi:DnaD domain protein [Christensenellaceae bacterium OttesenSCG-928-K19]|nr:DnaD domain protein [Christensenellaceae bacterium OttesenSCG-928-K19]
MIRFSVDEQAFTPVPTVFLKKYMCDAPEEYVRVYLYGLCLAHSGGQMDVVKIEEQLHQTSVEISAALEYWESKGFVRSKNTARGTTYEFLTSQTVENRPPEGKKVKADVYEYQGYNNMLSTILKRTLSASDLQKIYDYSEVFGLSQDVVITMVEYCVSSRGPTVSIAYMDKVAQTWAEEGIDSREKALQRVEDYKTLSSGARLVMKQMGLIGKSPGKTELDYYNKWTEKWGFTQESVLYAMRGLEFAKDQPFKYLDAVLRNLYENGATTSRKINEYNTAYANRRNNLKEVLSALDYSRLTVQPKHERFYDEWEKADIPHAIILLACEYTAKNGSRKFETVDTLLKDWQKQGITGEDDVKKYIRRQDTLERRIKQVYDCAGIKKQIGDADMTFYENCIKQNKMKHDVLMYAAEISSIANEPAAFLRKVLADWAKAGVTTLDMATAQNLSHYARDIKNNKKSFEQHNYTKDDLDRQKQNALKKLEELDG